MRKRTLFQRPSTPGGWVGPRIVLAVVTLLFGVRTAAADTLRMDARDLLAKSITEGVRLSRDASSIELDRGELFEDDGPAAGFSYKSNEEKLSNTTWIRKDFLIPDPRASRATLLVGPGGQLKGTVNGKLVQFQYAKKVGQYWQAYDLPLDVLKPGKNEVVLYGTGRIWIARDDEFASGSATRTRHANRSAKSTDAGKSWDYDRLGTQGDVDGEYYVRLFLDRYRSQGIMTLPVFDVANLPGRSVSPPITSPGSLRISVLGEGKLMLRIRSGSTYAPDPRHWTAWHDLGERGGTLDRPKGRFFQLAVILTTPDPRETPSLKQLVIDATPERSKDWTKTIRVDDLHTEEIVRSSVPFAYERFDHPRLKQFRQEFKLDAVVAGAKSDFERITRLAAWSSRQWERGHLREAYPHWDALEILKRHPDQTPIGGFCQQYNVVFLQACQSLGFTGRAVSLGSGDHGAKIRSGHEVVEIWSDDHKKWVYVDGQLARYHIDEKSGAPLSLWELRERQLALFRGKSPPPVKAMQLANSEPWAGLAGFPPFFEMRMIPRTNFLEQKAPLPLNQGMRGWFWTGHHVWTDADYPASELYGQRVTNRRNWEWTLNQTQCILEATETPRVLRVHLDSVTPGFETYLANIDEKGHQPIQSGYLWRLHDGKNRLEVRSRNVAGREGIPGRFVLDLRE